MLVTDYKEMGKGKVRITLETGTVLVLYRKEISGLCLSDGAEMTDEVYRVLLSVVSKRAKKRALYLLEKMDRSESKLREKLKASEYPSQCVDEAIEYVKSFHYLDDSRFARNYVRYHQDSLSRQQIFQKLLQKGIKKDDISNAIEEEYFAREDEQIKKLLEKKHYFDEPCDEKTYRRTYQFLLRRGFKSCDILKAMKEKV